MQTNFVLLANAEITDDFVFEMFVRMLTVHFDQNDICKITINGFQVRKINEIGNVIFGLCYGKPFSALRPKFGYSPS